jgi:predicted CXXCH cytochrome family protein
MKAVEIFPKEGFRNTSIPPRRRHFPVIIALAIAIFGFFLAAAYAQTPDSANAIVGKYDDDYCLQCHGDTGMQASNGRSVFVNHNELESSIHAGVSCQECHSQEDANFEDVPHFKQYSKVNCDKCHPRESTVWMEYFYKMLEKKGEKNIPDCVECHGTHGMQKKMPMEIVCDRCHQQIADEYRQSYHFQKYKEDTRNYPICITCHDPHFKSKKEVMSEIEYKQEIVDICSRCHQKDIETYIHSRHFHELEAGNPKAPVCTSCHEKHDIRKPSNPDSRVSALHISDVCNGCHPGHKESLHRAPGTDPSLISCATCHTGHQTDMASINQAIFKEGGIFNRCNFCHSSERHAKENLAHGKIMVIGDKGEEANCTHCHIYHWNMPGTNGEEVKRKRTECVNCHAKENREYKISIHGKAHAQGIDQAPYCTDCHGEKNIKKVSEQFTPEGVINLCSKCHTDRDLMLKFQINPYVVEGYKDTYHGKMFEMGNVGMKFAVCTNCHGSHTILPPDDPASSVNRQHIVETCKQCHPRANDRFVSYLVHPKKPSSADLAYGRELAAEDTSLVGKENQQNEPARDVRKRTQFSHVNKAVAGAMTLLLVSVLGIFGFHTILWFRKGIRGRLVIRGTYYRRIDGFHRFLHILVNISFLTLAFTGLPQSYARTGLAKWMFQHIMSLETAQMLHYIAAAITGFYFLAHVIFLILRVRKVGFKAMVTGPNTLIVRKKDFLDLIAHVKWFFGRGPHPQFDRWTYWEKFDYYAVFWGVIVIGLSGLIRLKEEFFGSLFGGGLITLADTIHKEEALLATAFIFIVHFFNTHLRAEKFPMDISVYTGRISAKEFKKERPLEYQRLKESGELDKYRVKPRSIVGYIIAYWWGGITLGTGMFLLALILIGQFTAR